MKRRNFIKTAAGLVAGSAISFPYILPSGRLFAQTGSQIAEHVVFVLFAGGVRHQEAIGQRYLEDSQYKINPIDENNVVGNIMPNMLVGEAPEKKIVYGMDPANGQQGTPGSIPIPKKIQKTIQEQGILFSEMTCHTAGHYNGLSALVSGNYSTTQGLRQKPLNPTIFEYVRKYLNVPASKVWFIGNGIGNSTPLLNYSEVEGFGALYGANFFAPGMTFGKKGKEYISDAKNYHPEEDFGPIYEMQAFLNNSFLTTGGVLPSIGNTPEEKYHIKEYVKGVFDGSANDLFGSVDGRAMNGDIRNTLYTCSILREFKPAITVVNYSNVDGCHSNFTGYLQSLHRADFAIGYLWNFIQNQPDLKNNTVLILAPEHGRNSEPNRIIDDNDWFAYDHSDANTKRNFAMMVGPDGWNIPKGEIFGSEGNPVGDTASCMLTAAEVLGCKQNIIENDSGRLFNTQSLIDIVS